MRAQREVSAVLYVNAPDWDCTTDGGALRLHSVVDGYTHDFTDVAPRGGRMVMFKSRDVPPTGLDALPHTQN